MYNSHNHIFECIEPGRRERGAMGSRSVEGRDGWGQWQLSTAETRTDWRSDHPVVLDVPSAAIFSLRRARAVQ